MRALKRDLPEISVCLAIGLLGIAAVVIGSGYRVGELTRMGPGFFPLMTGAIIVVLAIASAFESRSTAQEEHTPFRLRPIVFVALGMLAWIVLVQPFGLAPATLALIALSALAKPPLKPVSTLVLTIGLIASGFLVFIWGLGMPLTLFGR